MTNFSFHSSFLNVTVNFHAKNIVQPEVFRNFRTILPPTDTFSDLVDNENDQSVVRSFTDAFSGIDLTEEVTNRPFQYARAFQEIKVDDFFRGFIKNSETGNYPVGRFGDGLDYGVLYCALEKDTSEAEAIYYAVREFIERKNDLKEECFIVDRKMVSFGFSGSCMDLLIHHEIRSELISDNYLFCHELGKIFNIKVNAFKAPSARNENGICLPIFEKDTITGFNQKDSFKYNFRITIYKNKPQEIIVENFSTRIIDTSNVLS